MGRVFVRLGVFAIAAAVVVPLAAGAGRSSVDLSGVWTNPAGPGTTITITQSGAAITWVGGPNDHAWIQNYTATVGADNRFSGTFWQDAPGVSPQRYHGTINGAVVDSCHINLVDVIQTGQVTLHNVVFSKQGCTAAPKAPSTTKLRATISSSDGEVEYQHGSTGGFVTLTDGVVLREGDSISTGYDSHVTLNLGYGTLEVGSMTQLRLDDFLDPAHLGKTQLFLRVGAVKATVKHVAHIRSDFSVHTPVMTASVRGSKMVVSSQKNTATVYVVSDVAYVKGSADRAAVTVRHGYKTTVGVTHRASKPVPYPPSALPIR